MELIQVHGVLIWFYLSGISSTCGDFSRMTTQPQSHAEQRPFYLPYLLGCITVWRGNCNTIWSSRNILSPPLPALSTAAFQSGSSQNSLKKIYERDEFKHATQARIKKVAPPLPLPVSATGIWTKRDQKLFFISLMCA
jgi:hypothetical protein